MYYIFFIQTTLSLSSNFWQINCNNFFSLLFRQCHCHKSIPTIFFFFLLFRQCHYHKSIPTIFFPSISAMPLPQIHSHNFFPLYFVNVIATNQLPLFFVEKWYVHNIFTTNPKCQVVTVCYCRVKKVISVLNSNLN